MYNLNFNSGPAGAVRQEMVAEVGASEEEEKGEA